MGLIFLRHAYNRFLSAKAEIEPTLPKRGGQTRALTKEDFSGRGAIFLHSVAQFDQAIVGAVSNRKTEGGGVDENGQNCAIAEQQGRICDVPVNTDLTPKEH